MRVSSFTIWVYHHRLWEVHVCHQLTSHDLTHLYGCAIFYQLNTVRLRQVWYVIIVCESCFANTMMDHGTCITSWTLLWTMAGVCIHQCSLTKTTTKPAQQYHRLWQVYAHTEVDWLTLCRIIRYWNIVHELNTMIGECVYVCVSCCCSCCCWVYACACVCVCVRLTVG